VTYSEIGNKNIPLSVRCKFTDDTQRNGDQKPF
jgi:hypothetical protein